MPSKFVLDTNAYALLFQSPKSAAYERLEPHIATDNGELSFMIPEIVSMEIHSVIGKFRRGGSSGGNEKCARKVLSGTDILTCQNTCVTPRRSKINSRTFRGLQKLLDDIENGKGSIKAEKISLGSPEISAGKKILTQYADRLAFGSHDSLVAGTVQIAINSGLNLTLVTSDKSLKAVCDALNIPVFDPNIA